jgi:hypothetical protein
VSRSQKRTPAQERERRARIVLVVLAGVLVLVCAIQVPRMLHHASGDAGAAAASPAVTSASSPASASLAAAAVAPSPAPHLRRLRGFAWKDPFRQQLKASATQSSETSKPPATTKQAAPPQSTATIRTPPAVTESAPPSEARTLEPPAAKPAVIGKPGVLLLLDGRKLGLLPGDLFPTADPVFRLVSFTKKSAKVALVTGTLAGGTTALQLQIGHRLVLHDATTGQTYALVLVRPARVVPSAATKPPKS